MLLKILENGSMIEKNKFIVPDAEDQREPNVQGILKSEDKFQSHP